MSEQDSSERNLRGKYQALLAENSRLREEIRLLKARLNSEEPLVPADRVAENVIGVGATDTALMPEMALSSRVNNRSDVSDKIRLFMSLFKGRDDVYARRWENKKKGTSGYSPCCLNEWQRGLCSKPKGKCSDCRHKAYAPFDDKAVEGHLQGNIVAGVYPMLPDETCRFLAIDLDGGEWRKDVAALRETALEYSIPLAVERSRSGNGAHAWFFFETPLAAATARKFGTALLTRTMSKRHEITFKSYDRFFPNQDTMPAGGLGNLIALPLQKEARADKNSEFIDEHFEPYPDQWMYLGALRKITEEETGSITAMLCRGNELGILKIYEEEPQRPWGNERSRIEGVGFSELNRNHQSEYAIYPQSRDIPAGFEPNQTSGCLQKPGVLQITGDAPADLRQTKSHLLR